MLSRFAASTLLAFFGILQVVCAQTYTKCNPLNTTCPVDTGLQSTTFSTDFTKGENTSWVAATGTTLTYGDQGAEFIINGADDAPTIHTDFYIFFGYVEVKMRAANGTGIVSSIVMESDDLDEIDFEWLGGNNTSVETNYFGKGNTTSYDRAIYYPVTTPTSTFHTYALNWTSSSLSWLLDGVVVRTLEYSEALGGANYPQTPCRLNLGVWAGGASSSEGTVEWAGGKTDFDDAPFTMYVESVKIINYNPAVNYNWTDRTGSWSSIEIINSTVSSNSSSSSSSSGSDSGSGSLASAAGASASATTSSTGTGVSAAAASVAAATSTTFSQDTSGASSARSDEIWWSSGVSIACLLFGLAML